MLGTKVGLHRKHEHSESDPHGTFTDMGESDTSYNAINIQDDDNEDDNDGVTTTSRDGEDDSDAVATTSDIRVISKDRSKVNFEVDAREVDADSSGDVMTRERRLTLKQLERFRRAMAKRSRRGSRASTRWGHNGQSQVTGCASALSS